MIHAIIFDYGNVISRFDHRLFFKRMIPHSALSAAEIQAETRREPNLIVSYETGNISSEQFAAQAMERLQLSISMQEFKDAFVNIFERIPETLELIRRLKPHYRLGLLSNTNEWHYKSEIEQVDVFSLFDAVTLSFKVGAMKPAEKLFQDVLAKLELQQSACVYIDDISEYVEAGNSFGFRGIHYTSPDALVNSLRSLGVEA